MAKLTVKDREIMRKCNLTEQEYLKIKAEAKENANYMEKLHSTSLASKYIACPFCAQKYVFDVSNIGKNIVCPACKNTFQAIAQQRSAVEMIFHINLILLKVIVFLAIFTFVALFIFNAIIK